MNEFETQEMRNRVSLVVLAANRLREVQEATFGEPTWRYGLDEFELRIQFLVDYVVYVVRIAGLEERASSPDAAIEQLLLRISAVTTNTLSLDRIR
jgi:hypothetical protein